jgi:hypothetical protein
MNGDQFTSICTRTLHTCNGHTIIVQIGAPYQEMNQGTDLRTDSCCSFRIEGIGSGNVRRVWGIDGFQAIQLAMMAVGAELYSSDEARAGELRWEAGNVPGDLGFPVPPGLVDLVPLGASGL